MEKTKQIESNGQSWLLVEVPKDLSDPSVNEIDGKYYLIGDKGDESNPEFYYGTKPLPFPGHYTLYGKGDQLSEEQWREIVSWFELAGKLGYRDYNAPDPRFPFSTATESGLSWLTHHGFEPNKSVILKLVK